MTIYTLRLSICTKYRIVFTDFTHTQQRNLNTGKRTSKSISVVFRYLTSLLTQFQVGKFSYPWMQGVCFHCYRPIFNTITNFFSLIIILLNNLIRALLCSGLQSIPYFIRGKKCDFSTRLNRDPPMSNSNILITANFTYCWLNLMSLLRFTVSVNE